MNRRMNMNTNTDKTYNGWANYATWNINLWAFNEEAFYERIRGRVRGGGAIDGYEAYRLMAVIYETFDLKETPDGVSIEDPNIDWEEIAKSINESFDLT